MSAHFIPPPFPPYLLPQVINDGLVFAVVSEVRSALLQGLFDLYLQLVVGLLQVPHRLQVARQSVIQVLHGELLIAHDVCAVPAHLDAAGETPGPGAASHPGSHPGSQGASVAGGHADAGAASTAVDGLGLVDRSGGAGDGHGRGPAAGRGAHGVCSLPGSLHGCSRVLRLSETDCESKREREAEGTEIGAHRQAAGGEGEAF